MYVARYRKITSPPPLCAWTKASSKSMLEVGGLYCTLNVCAGGVGSSSGAGSSFSSSFSSGSNSGSWRFILFYFLFTFMELRNKVFPKPVQTLFFILFLSEKKKQSSK